MNKIIEISPRLAEWAALAGYTLTWPSQTDDGRALFWSAGGETRMYVGNNDDEWYTIRDSYRMGPEEFKFAARSIETVEKYLVGMFGEDIRSLRDLPDAHVPGTSDELAAGFTIGTKFFEQAERFALIDSNGSVIAVTSGGKLVSTVELVALSLYLPATIEDLTASFLDPNGEPLFAKN
jgi:hypothetical protein